jgi:beta-galactosidase
VITDAMALKLEQYVKGGGALVIGARAGYKDERGHCRMTPFPGVLANLCGATVEEFSREHPFDKPMQVCWNGAEVKTGPFVEELRPTSEAAQVIATYAEDSGYFPGKPAAVLNPWGMGRVLFYGGVFTTESAHCAAEALGLKSPFEGQLPRDVELVQREGQGGRFVILLNFSSQPQQITVPASMHDLISDQQVQGSFEMTPYGVLVLA